MSDSLCDKSLVELSQLLHQKSVSSVELTQAYLSRAQKLNSKTNAFITISSDLALEQARYADRQLKDKNSSPLTGIPFSLKDAYVTRDIPTTCASRVLENYLPQYNATVYQKLLDVNAVCLGKNNQDAWGHGGSSENTDFGPVKNPWDLQRTAGGSSGGTAAAVASGASAFGIGEDTGGSIRNPSSFCNTTGLKVTYGRVSRYGAIAYASSLDTVGPIGNSVADISLVLNAIAGFDPHDSSSSQESVPDYSSQLKKSLKGKVVGLVKEHFGPGLNSQVDQIIKKAAQDFQSLGTRVSEISIPTSKYGVAIYYLLALSETSSNLARYDSVRYGQKRSRFSQETKRRIMLGTFSLSSGYYDAYYKNALRARTKLIQEFTTSFNQVDYILAPVMPFPPYKFGYMDFGVDYNLAMYLADVYTCPVNVVGVPSLALPAGFTPDHLPVGMQLIGPMFSEADLLNAGYQYQQISNHHQQKPTNL